jgi:nitroimidazol reductase NimA-like FMN-containing flavoprotein (pyridoxamine 5'-phosphate oxidase superfamily)
VQGVTTTMSENQREEFLAGVHVGILSLQEPGRGPLAVPVWYDYKSAGELWFLTDRGSRKERLLSEGTRVSLCAQEEQLPYRYVTIEGPVVSIESADLERDARPMAHRYLGRDGGDRYADTEAAPGIEDAILVKVRPEHWLSADYSNE